MNIDPAGVHRLKNKLAVILGFCELLLSEMPADDPHRADVEQMQQAGQSALIELPPLAAHEIADALDPEETPDGR
jgi:signal transduction histidine kinase